jgi:arylsulfatase A-like enzyme
MKRLRARGCELRRTIGLALLAGLAAAGCSRATALPNLVIVLADDLGWNDVGWHSSDIATPNLDRLAAQGVKLERFYSHPTCTPTRAALLTGRYASRHGLQSAVLRPWEAHGLPLSEHTLAEALRQAGYRTALVGKWHLGAGAPEQLPTRRGFELHYGQYLGSIDHFTHRRMGGLDWHRNERATDDVGYSTELLAREAERVILEHDAAQPLFLLAAFSAPHAPVQAPPEYLARTVHLAPERRVYGAMVAALDDAVARVHSALEQRGMLERTLVLFASDNGGSLTGGASNRPLRGGKAGLYEGGVRVPAFALWPGRLPAGAQSNAGLHFVDVYPTLLGLAGRASDERSELDGRDAWPTLALGRPSPHEELLLHAEPNRGALVVGDWKLVLNGERPEEDESVVPADRRVVELFQLAADPGERRNLAGAQSERTRELLERLEQRLASAAKPLGTYRREPPPGYRAPAVWGEGPTPVGR